MEKTQKYKQTVIPEVSMGKWKELHKGEASDKMLNHYRTHYVGKRVINQHLGIAVEFNMKGAGKTTKGGPIYHEKKCLIEILDKMIEYAEYSNWGDRKESDPPHVIGYFNFKVKVKIDGKQEHVHLVVRLTKDGKFHYTYEVNVKKEKSR